MPDAKLIKKIRKLLNLSKSSNGYEAAIAIRQAQKLMTQNGLTEAELLADPIIEHIVTLKNWKASAYRQRLFSLLMRVFGIVIVFGKSGRASSVSFIGAETQAVTASYALIVLSRQLERDRKLHLKRVKNKANRLRRSDAFGLAWVSGISHELESFVGISRRDEIDAFIERIYADVDKFEKLPEKRLSARDALAGFECGQRAQLTRPLANTKSAEAQLELF
jgi:hypothetical protein